MTIKITFRSDWGVGTGTGRGGDVDKVIAKDRFGLPMVPGKTLTGMLRDACEEAAFALDEGEETGVWNQWVRWLFGDQPAMTKSAERPWPAALSIRPATLGAAAQQAAADDPRLVQASVTIRPGVQIQPETGVAKDDTLRMEERALSGLTATSSVSLIWPELPCEARVLLVCGAKLLQRLGGKRRRGAGRCDVVITRDGHELTVEADDFNEPTPPEKPAHDDWTPVSDRSDAPMQRRHFEVMCVTPVVASAGVKGNVVETLDYIPGYLLFPVVAQALGGDVGALIDAGRIRVSDATSAPQGVQLRPAPMCLLQPKGDQGPDVKLHNALLGEPEGADRFVAVKGGWLDPEAPLTSSIQNLALVERAHAVIDDDTQRPTETSGGLFVQQAIPAGTVLRFEVDLPEGAELGLSGKHAVGRSKKDDYGLIQIAEVDTGNTGPVTGAEDTGAADNSEVVAFVESDVLLLDSALCPTTSATALMDAVASALAVSRTNGGDAFHAVRRHETWSARSGLPRPSLVAIRAGTVVRFTAEGDVSNRVLYLGERQAEGFGRVLINPPQLLAGWEGAEAPHAEDRAVEPVSTENDANVTLLRETSLQHSLREAVLSVKADELSEILGLGAFTNSQLGLLRELVMTQEQPEISLRGDLAREKPPNTRLKALLDDPAKVHQYIDLTDSHDPTRARRLLLVHCIRRVREGSDAGAGDE